MAVATQWNTAKPAMGNQVSSDIPDIEENFEEIQRILECITNGTLGTTDSDVYKVDSIADGAVGAAQLASGAQAKGLAIRPNFTYKDADEIYIPAALYHHHGTAEQYVYWNSKLTYLFSNLAANVWCYLYLDDSAIVTAATNLLTATEFVDSVTPPTWSETKHGWYNGEDRCIFAVYGATITEFHHSGDTVMLADAVETQAAVDIDTTWTDVAALHIPGFAINGLVYFLGSNGAPQWSWRTNGQTGSTGHNIGLFYSSSGAPHIPNIEVITDSSQVIEMKASASDEATISYTTHGWKFPVGM